MNPLRSTLVLTLLFVAPTLAASGPPGRPPGGPQLGSEFMTKFRAAVKIGAEDEMAELIRKHENEAILAVIEACEKITERSSDQLEKDVETLGRAWKRARETDFVDHVYEYASLLTLRPEFKKERASFKRRYEILRDQFIEAQGKKDDPTLSQVGGELKGLGGAFEKVGDYFYASRCYLIFAQCFDKDFRKGDPDLRQACDGYRMCIEASDRIELNDLYYKISKEKFQALEYSGYGDPSKGPEARKSAKLEVEAAEAVVVPASFEIVDDVQQYERPNYGADGFYQTWTTLHFLEVDSSTTFQTIEGSPKLMRTEAAKILVDQDGDGTGDVELPMTGNVAPVQIELAGRPWAFLATIGRDQDTYQGFRFNLAPSDAYVPVYVAPAATVVGSFGEIAFRVLDDNMDGRPGTLPYAAGQFGLQPGSAQYDVDTIVIGEEKRARPWSEVQKIGDSWYRFEAAEDESGFTVTPTEVATGTLQLDFKGGDVAYLLVRGTELSSSYFFDLAPGGKKGTEVPAGTYELFSGKMFKGKRDQMAKALILPAPEKGLEWTVFEGGTTAVELGAPFSFDFDVKMSESSVKVVGKSVVVVGRGGETYQRPWNCVPMPEIHMRPAGKSRGKEEGQLRPAMSQEEVADSGEGVTAAWFPFDEEIEKKAGEEVEVQLVEKKNKLFGKVESAWKK